MEKETKKEMGEKIAQPLAKEVSSLKEYMEIKAFEERITHFKDAMGYSPIFRLGKEYST